MAGLYYLLQIRLSEVFEKWKVHLQPINVELACLLDPVEKVID